MGKAIHSDQAQDKVTYPQLLGVKAARTEARKWIDDAKSALDLLGKEAWPLHDIADYVLERQS